MISVDAFDLKMLAALQDDGRLTNQQLADLVGLSASQCSRRRMRLEVDGMISLKARARCADIGVGVISATKKRRLRLWKFSCELR